MMSCATAAPAGSFVAAEGRWTFTGALTFADAAAVFEASRDVPLPASGVVDLAALEPADSAALAVMVALSRRAAVSGTRLQFTSIPPGLRALAHVYGVDDLLAG